MLEPLLKPLAHPHGVFKEILKVHWIRKRPVILQQIAKVEDETGEKQLCANVRQALVDFEATYEQMERAEEEKRAESARLEKAREEERMLQRLRT
jgi:hypothetical protein